jgi:pyridoxine 5-phosphate synthase
MRLGVNIDHVATVRQARRGREPDPVWAVAAAELGGADQITLHLREDRRHIQDHDLRRVLETASVPVNLEMAVNAEMIAIARDSRPATATLVPERREEITTEGGLGVEGRVEEIRAAVVSLREGGLRVSLFVDPEIRQVEAAAQTGAHAVELHTGAYCEAWGSTRERSELERLCAAATRARGAGLAVHAGHGLTVRNVGAVARIPEVEELNIGHAIVGRAIFVGLRRAVEEMKECVLRESARR